MSCNYHVRMALLKTAAKKKMKSFLRAREIFKYYFGYPELLDLDEEVEYCWCGEELEYCDHCGDCEKYSKFTHYIYCPTCGIEM